MIRITRTFENQSPRKIWGDGERSPQSASGWTTRWAWRRGRSVDRSLGSGRIPVKLHDGDVGGPSDGPSGSDASARSRWVGICHGPGPLQSYFLAFPSVGSVAVGGLVRVGSAQPGGAGRGRTAVVTTSHTPCDQRIFGVTSLGMLLVWFWVVVLGVWAGCARTPLGWLVCASGVGRVWGAMALALVPSGCRGRPGLPLGARRTGPRPRRDGWPPGRRGTQHAHGEPRGPNRLRAGTGWASR
jgi:hypothetical protein